MTEQITAIQNTATQEIKKWVVANWKMNGSLEANTQLVQTIVSEFQADWAKQCQVVLAVPYPYLVQVNVLLQDTTISVAAQDLSSHEIGAFTGEVSAAMLRDLGVRYCLVGHSERRQYHGESDELVAEKVKIALEYGIKPIICLGETLAERKQGLTNEVIKRQLAAVVRINEQCITEVMVAYEPVWAIGTGLTASLQQTIEVHELLANQLRLVNAHGDRVPVLYGGSVNASNAGDLFQTPFVSGALVGGASLKAQDFLSIIRVAVK